MALFITRITLHDNVKDYNGLHNAMAQQGYERTIFSIINTVTVHLPDGHYQKKSSLTISQIEKEVEDTCATVSKSFSVFTSQVITWRGKNMPIV